MFLKLNKYQTANVFEYEYEHVLHNFMHKNMIRVKNESILIQMQILKKCIHECIHEYILQYYFDNHLFQLILLFKTQNQHLPASFQIIF